MSRAPQHTPSEIFSKFPRTHLPHTPMHTSRGRSRHSALCRPRAERVPDRTAPPGPGVSSRAAPSLAASVAEESGADWGWARGFRGDERAAAPGAGRAWGAGLSRAEPAGSGSADAGAGRGPRAARRGCCSNARLFSPRTSHSPRAERAPAEARRPAGPCARAARLTWWAVFRRSMSGEGDRAGEESPSGRPREGRRSGTLSAGRPDAVRRGSAARRLTRRPPRERAGKPKAAHGQQARFSPPASGRGTAGGAETCLHADG